MAEYKFLDKEGLSKFWTRTQEYIDDKDSSMREDLTALETALEGSINKEISDRAHADERILESLSQETGSRELLENRVSSLEETTESLGDELTSLGSSVEGVSSRLDSIEPFYVKDVLFNGESVVSDQTAQINIDVEGLSERVISKVVPVLEETAVLKSSVGVPGGVASLGEDGKVPESQLPTVETPSIKKVESFEDLPTEGETGIIYVVLSTNEFYKWDVKNSQYSKIGSGGEDLIPRIESLESQDVIMENQIMVLEGDLDSTKDSLEENISLLQDKDSSLDEDVESLRIKDSEIEGSLGDLSGNISVIESNLESKVSYEDVVDSLVSSSKDKPLSANQGSVLNSNLSSLENKVDSLQMTFKFKGTVSSYSELPSGEGLKEGEVYQIVSEGEDNGETYAWNGSEWLKISAAALDISSMLATVMEVNDIISKYSE